MIRTISQTALLVIGIALASQPSSAVTLTFGATDVDPYVESSFRIDIARIVNGNCDAGGNNASKPCMALNDNDVSTLTKDGGGVFTLNSFGFELQGNGDVNQLRVRSYVDATLTSTVLFSIPTYTKNVWYTYATAFADITSIIFDTNGGGNVRVDDINVLAKDNSPTPAATPLPGAVWLLGTILAGGAGFGRWRKRKAKRAALGPAAA